MSFLLCMIWSSYFVGCFCCDALVKFSLTRPCIADVMDCIDPRCSTKKVLVPLDCI